MAQATSCSPACETVNVLPRDEATFRFVNEANKTKSGPSIHIQTGGLRRGSGAVTSSTTSFAL
uniref:Uncharacterized protein n=1 Tax=Oryza barthii TaxID=65489 RepID=A0A0D3GT08_9ORYZ